MEILVHRLAEVCVPGVIGAKFIMRITTIQTGFTMVSSAVPDRSTRKFSLAYTGIFQKKSERITVPVKCFYVETDHHSVLIDTGWSIQVTENPRKHLGYGLYFASEPVMNPEEAAVRQLAGKRIDAILMTHLDCDHVSGRHDFQNIKCFVSGEEYEYAAKKRIRYGGLANGLHWDFLVFEQDSQAPFGRSCDVYGDGEIIAYLTPTHSAGSVIYRINGQKDFALIVGDNGYKEESWKKGVLPGPLYNADNMKKCLNWINRQSILPDCTGIFCAHDPVDRKK